MYAVSTIKNIVLIGAIGLCMGSWRDCHRSDQPCIQFGKRLCICTPFWNPAKMKRVYLYVCETAPFNTPKWVFEAWACPVPGIGNPVGAVWSTYLDPSIKGLIRLSDQAKNYNSSHEQVIK